MFVQKRNITASEEAEVEVEVKPEATDLLFEAEDVAELLAEVTEQPVDVSVDGEDIIFSVGEDEFVVTPEGDEELVESSVKTLKKPVAANRKVAKKAPVAASKQAPVAASKQAPKGKAIRKVSK